MRTLACAAGAGRAPRDGRFETPVCRAAPERRRVAACRATPAALPGTHPVPHHDPHQLPFSAASELAATLYGQAVDAILGARPAAETLLAQLLTEDPDCGMGRIALARLRQAQGRGAQARLEADRALALAPRLLPRERSHIEALASAVRGEGRRTLDLISAHMRAYPRDVFALVPATGVFGLFGFSGEPGREEAHLRFLQTHREALSDDWWFNATLAFAEGETGRLDDAARHLDKSWQLNPHSANTAHARAHIEYERGRDDDTLGWLGPWLAGYPDEGLMHCHLGWHIALAKLRLGDADGALEACGRWVHPMDPAEGQGGWGPPLNLVPDAISLWFRAWLRGVAFPREHWARLQERALENFPKPGVRFADFHLCLCFAMAGDQARLDDWLAQVDGPTAGLIRNAATGALALTQSRWEDAERSLALALPNHEILGGSRAQRDLLIEARTFAARRGMPLEAGLGRGGRSAPISA